MKDVSLVVESLAQAAAEGLLPRRGRILLAVSGGADSMALLQGAVEAEEETGWALSIGHVHHGWREREAERDLQFVAEHARRLGLSFVSRHRDARAASRALRISPEAGARQVRYAALAEMATETGSGSIVTAHQEDDVLESHLLALRRRGGLAALAGPRKTREDGVVRPLLGVPRTEILRYLAQRGIAFRRDASNGDLRLARNRLRRELTGLDPQERARFLAEIAGLRAQRDSVERELVERVLPRQADAAFLADLSEELLRAALERLASPYARPGRPPMTGREREQILRRLASGEDFRFEAGRRIRFERRGRRFSVSPAAPVYHLPIDTSTESEIAS